MRLARETFGRVDILFNNAGVTRMLSTREVGNAVAFLASDDASGITGAAL